MKKIIPSKLRKNDNIMVIAPSRSLSIISEDNIKQAKKTIEKMGYNVLIAKNAYKNNETYNCASIEDRINDLHAAFQDKSINCILTAIGGYNSNQILNYIDYDLIRNNPKIICGFSDITAILNAIYAKTGLITYYGPHFSTFGMKKGLEYTKENFIKCLTNEQFNINCAKEYSDDAWYLNQNNRKFISNDGIQVINYGKASGTILGGNLDTFNLLIGTDYMPKDEKIILFIEDDALSGEHFINDFDRDLESLLQTDMLKKIKGIVVGRAQLVCEMNDKKWIELFSNKKQLKNIPIVFNADFGHTTPIFTFPIGGTCEMNINKNEISIKILNY